MRLSLTVNGLLEPHGAISGPFICRHRAGVLWTGRGEIVAIKDWSGIIHEGPRSFRGAVEDDHLLNLELPGQAQKLCSRLHTCSNHSHHMGILTCESPGGHSARGASAHARQICRAHDGQRSSGLGRVQNQKSHNGRKPDLLISGNASVPPRSCRLTCSMTVNLRFTWLQRTL